VKLANWSAPAARFFASGGALWRACGALWGGYLWESRASWGTPSSRKMMIYERSVSMVKLANWSAPAARFFASGGALWRACGALWGGYLWESRASWGTPSSRKMMIYERSVSMVKLANWSAPAARFFASGGALWRACGALWGGYLWESRASWGTPSSRKMMIYERSVSMVKLANWSAPAARFFASGGALWRACGALWGGYLWESRASWGRIHMYCTVHSLSPALSLHSVRDDG